MCGIVGFTGNKEAAPILLDGLSKLEYRGYVMIVIGICIPARQVMRIQPAEALHEE